MGDRNECVSPDIDHPALATRHSAIILAMKLSHDTHTVHTKHPFVIARGGSSEWKLVRVRLVDRDGVEGWGEAAPNRFYGETTESAIAALLILFMRRKDFLNNNRRDLIYFLAPIALVSAAYLKQEKINWIADQWCVSDPRLDVYLGRSDSTFLAPRFQVAASFQSSPDPITSTGTVIWKVRF